MGTANMQGVRVTVVKEAVPAYEALAHIMTQWGYKIRAKDTGGYVCRNTASGSPSPHSTGTAVDINWNTNPATGGPYGGANRLKTDMPRDMVAAILNITTNDGKRVFGWGGNYSSFKDAMHFEIIAPRRSLLTGLNPATLRGFKPGTPATPGPVGGAVAQPGTPSTQGQGPTKPQGPAPTEQAKPPTVTLAPDMTATPIGQQLVPEGVPLTVLAAQHDRSITEPSTLTVRYADPYHQARILDHWRKQTTVRLDGIDHTLQRLDADADSVTAEYVETTAWRLTQHHWTADNRLVQSGGSGTRGAFMRAIVERVVPGAPVDIQPGQTALVDLATEPGDTAWESLRKLADDVKWRLFCTAGRIVIGADEWLARRTEPVTIAEDTPGVHTVTWSLVFGLDVSEATIVADTATWTLPPTQGVTLTGQGPANGLWIVDQVTQDLASPRVTVRLGRTEQALEEPQPEQQPAAPTDGVGQGLTPLPSPPPIPQIPGSGQPAQGPDKWTFPVVGYRHVTSPFGPRGGRLHAGVDLRAPTGTKIVAARPGRVAKAGVGSGYGNVVYIRHADGTETRYAHLSRILTSAGATVNAGQVIGLAGSTGNSTGPHLHFEIRPKGKPINPWPIIRNAPGA